MLVLSMSGRWLRILSLQDSIAEIEELIGGEINTIQVFRLGDVMLPFDDPLHYSGYIDYDKVVLKFGEEGLTGGPAYCTILLTKDGEVFVNMSAVLER